MTETPHEPLVPDWLNETAQFENPPQRTSDFLTQPTEEPSEPATSSPHPDRAASTNDAPSPPTSKRTATSSSSRRTSTAEPQHQQASIEQDLTTTQRLAVAVLVLVGVMVVAAAALAIASLRPTGPEAGSSSVLTAVITDGDTSRSTAAETLRDAIEEFERLEPQPARGGYRGSGRGWLNASGTGDYADRSIAETLIDAGLITNEELIDLADVLVHQCGDRFAIVTESATPTDPQTAIWWQQSGCEQVEALFEANIPIYVAMSNGAAP